MRNASNKVTAGLQLVQEVNKTIAMTSARILHVHNKYIYNSIVYNYNLLTFPSFKISDWFRWTAYSVRNFNGQQSFGAQVHL